MRVDKILKERLEFLITDHERLAKENTDLANNYRITLQSLIGAENEDKSVKIASTKSNSGSIPVQMPMFASNETGGTLKNIIVKELGDKQYTLSARSLRELYNSATGKSLSIASFSARMSGLVKEGSVKVITIPKVSIKEKFRYALPEWFDGGKLKVEYMKKTMAELK